MKTKLLLATALAFAPTQLMACDLDGKLGYGGAHRFNPFGGMHAPAPALPDQTRDDADPQAQSREQPDRASKGEQQGRDEQRRVARDSRAATSDEAEYEAPRKWDVEGGAPVSAEAKATFT